MVFMVTLQHSVLITNYKIQICIRRGKSILCKTHFISDIAANSIIKQQATICHLNIKGEFVQLLL